MIPGIPQPNTIIVKMSSNPSSSKQDTPAAGERSDNPQDLLRQLPGVDTLLSVLSREHELSRIPAGVLAGAARQTVSDLRRRILEDPEHMTAADLNPEEVARRAADAARNKMRPNLDTVIN